MRVPEAVTAADRRIRDDRRFGHTEHLLVLHGDREVAAHTYGNRSPYEPGDIFSLTKSVLSTLVGCAVSDGLLEPDTTLGQLLPGPLPRGREETSLRHLLTMTGGTDASGRHDIDEVMRLPSGWTRTILAAPRLSPPGAQFRYDNGAAHLLAACLQAALGEDLEVYAGRRLFRPLGIERWHWPRDPEGLPFGFGHLLLSPVDLLALGRLWLAGGVAPDGTRLFSEQYAAEATRAHTDGGPPEGTGYGFLWWVTTYSGQEVFFAGGYAGQHLVVVPSVGLITVTTGSEAALAPGWRPALDVIPGVVAAAVAEQAA